MNSFWNKILLEGINNFQTTQHSTPSTAKILLNLGWYDLLMVLIWNGNALIQTLLHTKKIIQLIYWCNRIHTLQYGTCIFSHLKYNYLYNFKSMINCIIESTKMQQHKVEIISYILSTDQQQAQVTKWRGWRVTAISMSTTRSMKLRTKLRNGKSSKVAT